MESLDDDPSDDVLPNASTLWTESHEKRANALEEICGAIIDKLQYRSDTMSHTLDIFRRVTSASRARVEQTYFST